MARRRVTSFARLHVVTNDEVVARDTFFSHATSVIEACGGSVALHLRAKGMHARGLLAVAQKLGAIARANGATLIVSERFDVALAADAAGVHLNASSISVGTVREVTAGRLLAGYSAHAADEAERAAADGADYVFLGTIWPSASHPAGPTAGVTLIRDTNVTIPVIAIGGVSPARAREAMDAGAYGVAVIAGVWNAADAAQAAGSYLESMQVKQ